LPAVLGKDMEKTEEGKRKGETGKAVVPSDECSGRGKLVVDLMATIMPEGWDTPRKHRLHLGNAEKYLKETERGGWGERGGGLL